MRRGAKPAKAKVEAKLPVARKSRENEGSRVRDLEERLAGALKREAEGLEQQTATAEILRVISNSPADAQPVFDAIAVNALRLCDAEGVVVARYDGALLHVAAHHNVNRETVDRLERQYPHAPDRHVPLGRAVLDGAVVHVPDLQAAVEFSGSVARQLGAGSHVSIPLLHQGRAVGGIGISRRRRGPFPDNQIELLKTFADQAVIAIENVRLFKELEARNRDLTEALEQQTATSEILRVISSSPTDVQPTFEAIAASATRLCAAGEGTLFRFDGTLIHLAAHCGLVQNNLIRRVFPRPAGPGSVTARAILTRSVVHIPDVTTDPDLEHSVLITAGFLTVLSVPMLRDGDPIGAITVSRQTVAPFSDAQIALLQTFADQAVIAIENVRLFTELQTRNRELTTALDRQTATSEILRVISSSPTDPQPVFDTIARSAAQLCDAPVSGVARFDGQVLEVAATHGYGPEALEFLRQRFPRRAGRETGWGRAVLECHVIHLHDVTVDAEYEGFATGYRTLLAVPMLRKGTALGAIAIWRGEVKPFSDQQIALVETFALTEAHAQTTEALEQQTATSEILRVISSSPTELQPVLDAVAERAARLCNADDVNIHLVEGEILRLTAKRGPIPTAETRPIVRTRHIGRVVLERRTIHVHDIRAALDEFPDAGTPQEVRTALATPLLREGVAIGVIHIRRLECRPFTEKQITLLETFADQAVIAIENVRLFKELEVRNRDLSQALDRQTATADVLRIIAQSPTELQPVLDAIATSAVRLCAASDAVIERLEGDRFYNAAHAGAQMKGLVGLPLPLSRRFPGGRAVLDRKRVILDDIHRVAETEYPDTLELLKLNTIHSVAEIPLLSEGKPLGSLAVLRAEVRPFTDAEVALLETFASQAVIAIENVRLFKELEARTQELTRSVGELRALGEVGQAISSTLDLQTVLSTIVARATQLTGVDAGVIYEYDEQREVFEPRATERLEEDIVRMLVATPVGKGQGVTGRLAEVPEPIQIADVRDIAEQIPVRDVLIRAGYRALLAVPLIREDHLIGGLTVFRKTAGEFTPATVDLLRTFATQSALAIQNARLFREIADKSRQLEVASQHKSEFLANMSHELRTPLNAIIGFSEVLTDRMFGELNEKQEEYLKDIYASGTHLLSLINDILDLSKIEAGRMELELTDFDLPTALDNALILVRERAGRRSITLQMSVDERLGQIRADERKIRQVVLNLLSNAIKFTPEGGRIEVAGVPKDGFVEVSVSDTGVGIAPEDQEAVFEEFLQVGTAEKKAEGTGLGLTLCRKFIELHGGRIWVQSQVGVGSTFTFAIPVSST